MRTLTEAELDHLTAIAHEIVEAAAADAYQVDDVLAMNGAFRQGRAVSSSLERSLILAAAEREARGRGLGADRRGHNLDIITTPDGRTLRYFRVKSAERQSDGQLRPILVGPTTTLLRADPGEEKWFFGFVRGEDHLVTECFVAEILRAKVAGSVTSLVLGREHPLETNPGPRRFKSDDDGLFGFDDDGDEAEEGDGLAG